MFDFFCIRLNSQDHRRKVVFTIFPGKTNTSSNNCKLNKEMSTDVKQMSFAMPGQNSTVCLQQLYCIMSIYPFIVI